MSEAAFPSIAVWPIDPVFTYARTGRLDLDYGLDPVTAWRHLSILVARDPLDLEAHVRRILFTTHAPHHGKAFGALLDLFLALGAQGQALRQMMLDLTESCIEPDEARFLRAHLETGLARNALLPGGTGALLDVAVIGSAHAVRHERVAEQQGPSRVDEAISLLDHGDLPGARALLEEIVLDEPTNEVATRELLGIYHHSRDNEGRQAMRAHLQQRHGDLPPAWA